MENEKIKNKKEKREKQEALSSESRITNHACHAVMLLEVILALGILFVGMAVVGIQINSAVASAHQTQRLDQALMLAQAKLAQLDTGVIQVDREVDGHFGKSFPGYFWRFQFEPSRDMENMFEVRLDILYSPPALNWEPGDIDDAQVVTTLHTLRPTPPTLNLQRDFGFNDEQMAEIAAKLPPDIADPTEISPAMFRSMDAQTLMELMPQLVEAFGLGFGFSAEQIQQAIESGILDPSNLPTGAIDSELKNLQDGKIPPGTN